MFDELKKMIGERQKYDIIKRVRSVINRLAYVIVKRFTGMMQDDEEPIQSPLR